MTESIVPFPSEEKSDEKAVTSDESVPPSIPLVDDEGVDPPSVQVVDCEFAPSNEVAPSNEEVDDGIEAAPINEEEAVEVEDVPSVELEDVPFNAVESVVSAPFNEVASFNEDEVVEVEDYGVETAPSVESIASAPFNEVAPSSEGIVAVPSVAVESSNQSPEFKLILLSEGHVGKTEFLKSLESLVDEIKHVPTLEGEEKAEGIVDPMLGADIYRLKFTVANRGPATFNVWDKKKYKNEPLPDGFFFSADCAIIMFDVTDENSYKAVRDMYLHLPKRTGSGGSEETIPAVVVGNKVDVKNRRVKKNRAAGSCKKKNLPYYDVSAQSGLNVGMPFLWLIRRLTEDNTLNFENLPDSLPPDAFHFMAEQRLLAQEEKIAEAAAQPFPDDGF